MRHDLPSKPTTEDLDIVLIGETVLLEALEWVSGCEICAENAFTMFGYLLDAITGCDPTITEYVMWRPGRCPHCAGQITEKTRIAIH